MAVRSRNLAILASLVANTWTGLYTVPAGRTLIVKQLGVVNLSGATRRVDVRVRRGAVSARVAMVAALAPSSSWRAPVEDLTLDPGDSLELWADDAGTNVVQVVASGALLLGPPE